MSEEPQSRSSGCTNCLTAAGVAVAVLVSLVYVFWPKDFIGPSGPHCLSHVKALALGLLRYTEKHEGRLPATTTWLKDIGPYAQRVAEMVECPEPGEAGKVRHVMHPRWSGVKLDSIADPASAILLYDAVNGKPAFRHRPDWSSHYEQWRNALSRPGVGIGYADGHCAWTNRVTAEMIAAGRDTTLSKH